VTNWTLCLQTHSLYLTKEKKLEKFKFKDSFCVKLVLMILNFCHLKWPFVYIGYAHLPKPGQHICKLCFSNGDLFCFLQQDKQHDNFDFPLFTINISIVDIFVFSFMFSLSNYVSKNMIIVVEELTLCL
jgi:hypothetical protein